MKSKTEDRKKAREMRLNGESINNIASILNVSKGSVSSWVKDIILTDEQKCCLAKSDTSASSRIMAEKYKEIRKNWQKEGATVAKEKNWDHAAGCMLYWAEGAKSRNSCGLGNSDPNIMKFFVNFIRKNFDVAEDEFRIDIRVYLNNALSINEIKEYWKGCLGISDKNITHIKILDGVRNVSGKKKNIHPYGICNVRIHRTDIVQRIFGAIQEYAKIENYIWIDKK